MKTKNPHWTERSIQDFRYRLASDFVSQLEGKMNEQRMNQSEFANKLGLTESRVSQILNNPGNLTLDLVIKCARVLGLKPAVVAYDDSDPQNLHGPINAQIFDLCWQQLGKPRDFWALEESRNYHTAITTSFRAIEELRQLIAEIKQYRGTDSLNSSISFEDSSRKSITGEASRAILVVR